MEKFTNAEMTDMHFVYGQANGNTYEARRIYAKRYPKRITPDPRTFTNLHRRLQENGTFKRNFLGGLNRYTRTPDIEENILNEIANHPETSTRKIASSMNQTVSHQTVWRTLKEQYLYPYHKHGVQALLPRDLANRVGFCKWYLKKVEEDPMFDQQILFTDEANFSRNAIQNSHNNHLWAEENPHAIIETHFQYQFSVNVWVGIIGDHLVGPFFLPSRLDGSYYRKFLETELAILLESVPLFLRKHMWFMHDGAPAHFFGSVKEYLNKIYPLRWIGRGGPQEWPSRSPDLNSLDFFLWGHMKSLVYTTPIEDKDDLIHRITEACETIRNTPGILERVRSSMRRRAKSCVMVDGGHFQQFL